MTPIDKAHAALVDLEGQPNPSPLDQILAQTLRTALSRHPSPTPELYHLQASQALRRAYT